MVKIKTVKGKRQKDTAIEEAAKQIAKREYLNAQDGPPEGRTSLRALAEAHRVDHVTLWRLVNGRQTMPEAAVGSQLLTPAEEGLIINFIIGQAARGLPPTHQLIKEWAYAILKKGGTTDVTIGESWVYAFKDCHPNLRQYRATPLEEVQANGLNLTVVRK